MPQKRINRRGNSEQSIAGGTLAECVLPEEMMLCILTRLPVKTIHRFKSVCKPWHKAFSSLEFRKMHRAQFSKIPENQSIIIHGHTVSYRHIMSLLKINSKPTKLEIPFPQYPFTSEFVGCCNGLLCTSITHDRRVIFLWNPALGNMSKLLPFPRLRDPETVSLGFGYNEESDDFTVVRIVALKRKKETGVGVEVYSANSDSWTSMEPGFKFKLFRTRNEVIVNGSPYWAATVDDEKPVLLCFDVREMVFKIVPLPDIFFFLEEVDADFKLVDLKGNLGALVCKTNEERVLSLDLWVFNDVGKSGWTMNRRFGTIELKVYSFLQCLKKGNILVGECLGENGKVFVFDTETGGADKIVIDEAQKGIFQICGYTESLAYIKGMKNPQTTLGEKTKRTAGCSE